VLSAIPHLGHASIVAVVVTTRTSINTSQRQRAGKRERDVGGYAVYLTDPAGVSWSCCSYLSDIAVDVMLSSFC
jgi:sensor c-di-GMP phosphodiesterase-like protein